jgi:Arc/MetJ family transcription regulator
MKTTIDIPDELMSMTMKFSKAKTKKDAIVAAMEDYTRRERVLRLSAAIKKKPLEMRNNEEIEAADLAESTRRLADFQSYKS